MIAQFLNSYFLPAGVVLLAFWAIWQVVRMLELPVWIRRTVFVLLGTLGFSPMIVPAGIILIAWVPHGLLVTTLDIGYYVQFARFVFPSFVFTALVFTLIAIRTIREDAVAPKFKWHSLLIPIFAGFLVFSVYRLFVPDRDVSQGLSGEAIESEYGEELDAVASLLGMESSSLRKGEAERLRAFFDGEDSVVKVYLQTPSAMEQSGESIFEYARGPSPRSESCSGSYLLMRCTWSFDTYQSMETLRYRRTFEFSGEKLVLEIEFEYDKIRDQIGR